MVHALQRAYKLTVITGVCVNRDEICIDVQSTYSVFIRFSDELFYWRLFIFSNLGFGTSVQYVGVET